MKPVVTKLGWFIPLRSTPVKPSALSPSTVTGIALFLIWGCYSEGSEIWFQIKHEIFLIT